MLAWQQPPRSQIRFGIEDRIDLVVSNRSSKAHFSYGQCTFLGMHFLHLTAEEWESLTSRIWNSLKKGQIWSIFVSNFHFKNPPRHRCYLLVDAICSQILSMRIDHFTFKPNFSPIRELLRRFWVFSWKISAGFLKLSRDWGQIFHLLEVMPFYFLTKQGEYLRKFRWLG